MASGYRLGVDLGTTYTAAAIERDGRVEICTLGDRTTMIPSVAIVRPNGEIIVGEAAERRAASEPTAVAREFKRRLGDPAPLVLGGVSVTPEALMAAVLRHVVALVTTREDRPPDRIVLSHPASYGPYKTGLMRTVASLADVGEVELVAEPQAAAISYAQRAVIETGKVVAVYDFGGGTFDAALVRRTPTGGFDIVGQPEGVDRLGGIDLDQLLMEHVLDAAGVGDVISGTIDEATLAALVELRDRCQAAKEALSNDLDTRVAVNVGGTATAVRVTRDDLNDLVRPRIIETVEALQRAIRNSGLSTGDIDRVLLVGGSSRIPLVADTVRATLHRPVTVDANPKTAICEGAALVLATRTGTPIAPPSSGFAAPVVGGAIAGAAVAGTAAAAPKPPSIDPATAPTAPLAATAATPPPPPGGAPTAPNPTVPPGPPPGMPGFTTTPPPGVGGPPPPGGPIDPPPPSSPPPKKRRGLFIGIGAAILVALVIGAIVVLAGGDDDKTATTTTEATTRPTTATTERTTSSTDAPPTDPVTTTAEVTTAPPAESTTTTIAPSVTQVGKTVYFAGFQIDIATATFTPSEFAGSNGDLVLAGTGINLADDNANLGFIGITAPVTLVIDGLSNSISIEGGDVPPGGKGKLTLKASLPEFDAAVSVVDFGGTQFNGSLMPLGPGDVTTTAPATQAVSGSGTSANGLTVTLTDTQIVPFSPMAGGGGDVAPAPAGELFLGLHATVSFAGDFDDGVFNPLLVLPDGSTEAPFDSQTALVTNGASTKDFYVFKIPSTVAGNYAFRFSVARAEGTTDVPFSLS